MSKSNLLGGAAILLAAFAATQSANAQDSFTSFDPKGSTYTFAAAINASGTVAGYYDDFSRMHGFVRAADGTITSFDPEGSTYTEALSINANGDVAGWYRVKSGMFYGFVRASDGTITTFNPAEGREPGAVGLNANGNVTGWYMTESGQRVGFVGAPGGTITQLTVGGVAMNARGTVTGVDGPDGFVRSPSGKTTTFVAPGSPSTTLPMSINDSGVVAGYGETECGISQGFTRDAHGNFATVVPSGSSYSQALGINGKDDVTGYYYYGGYHGFVLSGGGVYTSFDVPGATDGTYPQSINARGEVAGGYRDSDDVLHGFVGMP